MIHIRRSLFSPKSAPRFRAALALTLVVIVAGGLLLSRHSLPNLRANPDESTRARVVAAYGRVPLSFEINRGQTDSQVKFLARGPGYGLFLTGDEAVLQLHGEARRQPHAGRGAGLRRSPAGAPTATLRIKPVGTQPASAVVGLEELPGRANYFLGSDPQQWRADVPSYAKVKYRSVYPGVDLIYYGNQRQLEYDFIVAPGVDPRVIRLEFAGAQSLRLDTQGDLIVRTAGGELRQRRPIVYQETSGGRKTIDGHYTLRNQEVGFELGDYDASRPLVIDPVLIYSTYLGGTWSDQTVGMAIDAAGNAYVAGSSASFDFPGVAPLNGNRALYKSTNGGGLWSASNPGLTDPTVNALAIAPHAQATPATLYAGTAAGVFKSTNNGGTWSASNTGLPEFTFIQSLAIDPLNPNTVYAGSFNGLFKTTNGGGNWNPADAGLPASFGVFSLALNPVAPATVYAVVFDNVAFTDVVYRSTNGGGSWEPANTGISAQFIYSLTIDPLTPATLYATTNEGVYKSTNGGGSWSLSNSGLSGTPVKSTINPAAPATLYASTTAGLFKTTNGGGNWSLANTGLPADSLAQTLVVDPTNPNTLYGGFFNLSTGAGVGVFKTTNGGTSWSASNGGVLSNDVRTLTIDPADTATIYAGAGANTDVFVAKLNAAGSALTYATYLGGNSFDFAADIAADGGGNVYLTGGGATDFPLTPGAFRTDGFAFAAKLNATGGLAYSTRIPDGDGSTVAQAVATDAMGRIYVGGATSATDFPTTTGAFQRTAGGGKCFGGFSCDDAFVLRLNPAGGGAGDLQYSTYLGGGNEDFLFDIAVDGTGRIHATGQTGSSNFPRTAGAFQSTFGGGVCDGEPCADVFVSRLNPAGGGAGDLQYSTYLGGNGSDSGYGIAVDGAGAIYVTGGTASTGFPTTANAYQTTCADASCSDAFLARINPAAAGAASLPYSTFFGGGDFDYGQSVAVDAAGGVYVAGGTGSNNLPITSSAFQLGFGGGVCGAFPCTDVFVAKFNLSLAGAAGLSYSSYLGGGNDDFPLGMAVDTSRNVYVAGVTFSTDFPTRNAFQPNQPGLDGFLTKICDGPDLTLAKTHSGNFIIGGAGVYSLLVSNAAAACATVGPITINDSLPGNLALLSFSGGGWNCTGTATSNVNCSQPGPLAAGASLPPLMLMVNVGAGTPVGANSITNTAVVATTGEVNTADNAASDPTTVSCADITVNPATLPNGFIGASYNQTVSATGGLAPYTFSLAVAGSLPTGVSLNITTGALIGTLNAIGVFSFTIAATDANNCVGLRQYTVVVSGTGLMFYPLPRPLRLLDTRADQSLCDNISTPITGGTSINTLARLTCDGVTIPANAQAIVGNVTVINQTASFGFLTLFPAGQTLPLAANIIYEPGQLLSNNFTVGLNANGEFSTFAERTLHTVIDVSGYFAPPTPPGLFYHALPRPLRLLDTRADQSLCDNVGAPISGGTALTTQARISCNGLTIPTAAQAIVSNATVINQTASFGFMTLFPSGQTLPLAANMIYAPNQLLANAFTVGLSADGRFDTFAERTLHLVIDVAGYYSPEANDANGPGLLFNPLPRPLRLLDTRPDQSLCDNVGLPIAAGTSLPTQARISCNGITIPNTAQAVNGNITVINQTAQFGFLTLFPAGQTLPLAANMIYAPGQLLANAFVVGLSGLGEFNTFGERTIHVVVDVSGYFAP